MKDGAFCLQCLAQSGLLTSPHVHTGCLWFVWASEKMWDTFEFQTFREFCSRCFTSGIVWTPPPQLSALQDIFRLNVPSPVKMCLRCACEGSHMCVHSGMRFCSLPAICGFFFGVFSQSAFLTLMKNLIWVVFLTMSRSHDWLWNTPLSSVWQNHREWIWLSDIMAVFPQRKTLPSWSGKLLHPCELQKHKHMPKEFQGNNLASWFKLEASCMKRGRPHTTFPWSLQGIYPGTPLWRNTT